MRNCVPYFVVIRSSIPCHFCFITLETFSRLFARSFWLQILHSNAQIIYFLCSIPSHWKSVSEKADSALSKTIIPGTASLLNGFYSIYTQDIRFCSYYVSFLLGCIMFEELQIFLHFYFLNHCNKPRAEIWLSTLDLRPCFSTSFPVNFSSYVHLLLIFYIDISRQLCIPNMSYQTFDFLSTSCN